MTLDTELSLLQNGAWLIPGHGRAISNAIGRIRSNLPRIQKDAPELLAFLEAITPLINKHLAATMAFYNDLAPVINKHYKPLLASISDLIPIVQAVAKDLKE
jgi:hypothetical protein